jgi:hypothetical protein
LQFVPLRWPLVAKAAIGGVIQGMAEPDAK